MNRESPEQQRPWGTWRENVRWWWYYHTRTEKGRFETYHFFEWIVYMTVCTMCMEVILLWLGA